MTLFLDHQQRLNLIALMGTQRVNVADMRMFSNLIDHFDLTDEEKRVIGYQTTTQNGVEIPSWNRELKLAPRSFDVTQVEGERLRRIIEEWPHFLTVLDRAWIFPLLEQLPEAAPAPAN